MNILPVDPHLDQYRKLVQRLACGKDYTIYSDGFFEIDEKCSRFALGIDVEGNIFKGQIQPGKIHWYPATNIAEVWR